MQQTHTDEHVFDQRGPENFKKILNISLGPHNGHIGRASSAPPTCCNQCLHSAASLTEWPPRYLRTLFYCDKAPAWVLGKLLRGGVANAKLDGPMLSTWTWIGGACVCYLTWQEIFNHFHKHQEEFPRSNEQLWRGLSSYGPDPDCPIPSISLHFFLKRTHKAKECVMSRLALRMQS